MKTILTLIIASIAAISSVSCTDKPKELKPLTEGGMETGKYRNLFAEMGYSQDAIDKKVQEVFDGVFFGPNKVYFEVEDSLAYISDIKNNDARTEGMSYGLMIAVQFDRRDIFDKLWRWSKKYMQNKEGVWKGYFAWSCKVDGTINSANPASDGELYFITALLFASNRWGNDGSINYLAEAQYLLDIIQPKEVEMPMRQGPRRSIAPEMGKQVLSLIDPETKLITFVPGMKWTDPSYHIPAFYEVWAEYGQDGRADFWRECAVASREYLHKSINAETGLNPDNNNFDGTTFERGFMRSDVFRYDSWRVPMNIAMDYSWACKDQEWQQNYGKTIQNFLYKEGIDKFVDQYNVDGTHPDEKDMFGAGGYKVLRHSVGFVATAAAASLLCCDQPISREFVDRLWNSKHEPYEDGYFDAYYDGLLRLFAFMHLSGRYQVIKP